LLTNLKRKRANSESFRDPGRIVNIARSLRQEKGKGIV